MRIDGSYEVERTATGTAFQERWTKLGLLGATELGETKAARPGLVWIASTASLDPTTQTVMQKRYRPGATAPDITESRAGVAVRETDGAAGTVLTRVADALGRPVSETQTPQNRTTTYAYDYATGGVASTQTTATAAGAQTTLTTSQTYHPASDPAFGRVKTRTETGLTTNYAYTARGELAATWGATYPVRYSYDAAGRLVKMETYRSESYTGYYAPAQWPAGDK